MKHRHKKRRTRRPFSRRKRFPMSPLISYKGPLQQKVKTTMKYADTYTHTSGAGFPLDLVWNLSSVYDVDTTGVGHQPRGFDQLMSLYDHFVVIGVNVDCIISNHNPNQSVTTVLSVRDNNVAINDIIDHLESTTRRVGMLAPEGTGGNTKRFKFNINPNKFLGRSKPLADPSLKGSETANPTEAAYLHLAFADTQAINTVIAQITMILTYTVVLIEPKNVGQS